jgi:hypothetical protein
MRCLITSTECPLNRSRIIFEYSFRSALWLFRDVTYSPSRRVLSRQTVDEDGLIGKLTVPLTQWRKIFNHGSMQARVLPSVYLIAKRESQVYVICAHL